VTSFVTDSLADSLLQAHANIQMSIAGVNFASKHLFEAVRGPFPAFHNYIVRDVPDYSNGTNIVQHTIDVGMRLIGGPITSGILYQAEDALNQLMFAIMNNFSNRKFLDDPLNSNKPYDYIAPLLSGCQIVSANRIAGFKTSQQATDEFLIMEFTNRVPLQISIPRLS
jgi:hypothetical protein